MRGFRSEERGSALITAIVLVGVMMSIGLATASFVDGQQRQSGDERVRESAFNVGEAALGAQVFQLSRTAWPTAATPLPAACTSIPDTSATATCPSAASLAESYKTTDYSTVPCPAAGGTTVPALPAWTTTVHDDVGAEEFYNAKKPDGTAQPKYDFNANGRLWVKATGTARCKKRTLVTAVQQGTRTLTFPKNVVTANWVATSNNGRKVIIDTKGPGGQPVDVVLRCTGFTEGECRGKYQPGQISPSVPKVDPAASPTASPVGDLAAFKALASKQNTYYPAGTCPSSLAGQAVYIEDYAGCNASGNANTAANPGHLYIAKGTLTLGGNTRFYGLVYMGNLPSPGSSGAVVTLSGNARIQGAVAIDGLGGLVVGSSKMNLVYDGSVFDNYEGISSVALAPNSWRELKPGS